VCAACGGRLRKVFSPVGIVFKGSGFYRTDSRNGSVSASDKKDKKDSESKTASDGNGSADKKDSKPKESASASSKSSSEKVA
jgi:predicted nucleic acid-binding Zn ribbon protein